MASIVTLPPRLEASIGCDVEVLDGPFEGSTAVLNKLDPARKSAELILDFMGTTMVTSQPVAYLLDDDEKARFPKLRERTSKASAVATAIARIEQRLVRLEELGLYKFDIGPTPVGANDLYVRENWIWLRGGVRGARLRTGYGVQAELVCTTWFLRVPLLFISTEALARCNAGLEDRMTVADFAENVSLHADLERKVHGYNVYLGREFRHRELLRAAVTPADDPLVHAFRREAIRPLSVLFGLLPEMGLAGGVSRYLALPLLDEYAVAEGVVRMHDWGTIMDRFDLEEALAGDPAFAKPSA